MRSNFEICYHFQHMVDTVAIPTKYCAFNDGDAFQLTIYITSSKRVCTIYLSNHWRNANIFHFQFLDFRFSDICKTPRQIIYGWLLYKIKCGNTFNRVSTTMIIRYLKSFNFVWSIAMNEWTNKWTNARMNEWINERINELMNELMN